MHRLRRLRRHLPQRSHHRSLSFSFNTRDWNRARYCTGLCPFCLYNGTWPSPNPSIKTDQSLWLFNGSIITGPFCAPAANFRRSVLKFGRFCAPAADFCRSVLKFGHFCAPAADFRRSVRKFGHFCAPPAEFRCSVRNIGPICAPNDFLEPEVVRSVADFVQMLDGEFADAAFGDVGE